MKSKIQLAHMALVLALPVSLLVAGCKDKTTEAIEAPPLSNRTNSARADADNSARNVRDRNDATMTPLDQSNTPEDREVTQKIRKALVLETSGTLPPPRTSRSSLPMARSRFAVRSNLSRRKWGFWRWPKASPVKATWKINSK